jgi:hypothetical protein
MSAKSFGVVPWLSFFFVALVSIPVCISFDWLALAKFIGFAVTVSLVVVLRIWLHRLGKLGKPSRIALNSNDLFELKRIIPALQHIPSSDQIAFQHRIGMLMSQVTVQQDPSLGALDATPKYLAMIGATLFFLNGREVTDNLLFTLKEHHYLQFSENQLTSSLDSALDSLSSCTAETLLSALAV